MKKLSEALSSQIGRKVLTGITGLGLIGFVIVHLAGNLLLLTRNPELFNNYAHKLESLGIVLYIAEFGLLALVLTHAAIGISIFLKKSSTRGSRYEVNGSAGGTSHQTLSSRTMAITGTVLFLFIVLHIMHMKFGVFDSATDRSITLHGEPATDLFGRVNAAFSNLSTVLLYCVAMIMLGLHLRHGFWSAFQSLGIAFPKYTKGLYCLGVLTALFIALGFLIIPIYLYVAQA